MVFFGGRFRFLKNLSIDLHDPERANMVDLVPRHSGTVIIVSLKRITTSWELISSPYLLRSNPLALRTTSTLWLLKESVKIRNDIVRLSYLSGTADFCENLTMGNPVLTRMSF